MSHFSSNNQSVSSPDKRQLHIAILGPALAAAALGSPLLISPASAHTVNAGWHGGFLTGNDRYTRQDNPTGAYGMAGNTLDFNKINKTVTLGTFDLTDALADPGITLSSGNGTFDSDQDSSPRVLTAAIGGTGTLIFTNTAGANNIIRLNGNNSGFTGTFAVNTANNGSLQIAASNAAGDDAASFDVNAGTLDLTASIGTQAIDLATETTLGTSAGTAAAGGNIATAGKVKVNVGGTQLTLSGVVGGGGNIIKAGTGVLVLSNTNTNTGNTTINAGTVRISNALGLGQAGVGTVEINQNGTLEIDGSLTVAAKTGATMGNGATLSNTAGDTTVWSTATAITGTGNVNVAGTQLTMGGVVSGTGRIDKAGAGILVLSNTNTYTGDTNINAGTVRVENNNGLGADGNGTVAINTNGTLELNGNLSIAAKTATTMAGGTLSNTAGDNTTWASNIAITGAGNVLVDGTQIELSGVVSGGGGIIKAGTGTLLLSNTNTNTGNTTINAGTVRITNALGLGAANNGVVAIGSAGTLEIDGSLTVAAKTGATMGNGATLSNTAGDTTTWSTATAITGTGNVNVAGASLTMGGVVSGTGGITKAGAGTLELSQSNTYTGTTTINAGTIQFEANDAIRSGNSVVIADNAFLDLNGNRATLAVTGGTTLAGPGSTLLNGSNTGIVQANSATINGTNLTGTLNTSGTTSLVNVLGSSTFNLNSGTTTLTGSNAFGNVNLNSGTLAVTVPVNGPTPMISSGTVNSLGGIVALDASSLSQAQLRGEKTIIQGSVTEAVAKNTTITYEGQTRQFVGGFNAPISNVGPYDVQLLQNSLVLSVQLKDNDDICGVTGLCPDGSLPGTDENELSSLWADVVRPALQDGNLDLSFWSTQAEQARFLISGLMPTNVDAAGIVISSYNNRMTDTVFERLPMRQFTEVSQIVEDVEVLVPDAELIPDQDTEPIRGLWSKNENLSDQESDAYLDQVTDTSPETETLTTDDEFSSNSSEEVAVLQIDGRTYQEDVSLTSQYSKRSDLRAWVRGFGGDVSSSRTTNYLYRDFNGNNGGGLVGFDYAAADNFQIGAYANYGSVNINTKGNDYASSGAWNADGFGGGITADYWTDSFYVQGLIGASSFSGNQKRSLVSIGSGLGGNDTMSGEKSVTSIVGALRAGAPMQVGNFYLEPQVQATWTGNQEHSFSESGSGNYSLKYKGRQTNFLQTELGIKIAYPIFEGDTSHLVPSLRVAWLGDWNQNNQGQKIGYQFSDNTVNLNSYQQNENAALIEAGLDYTTASLGSTSFKIYGRGGAEIWGSERGTNWRASGGVTFKF